MPLSIDPVNNLENLISKNKTKNNGIYIMLVLVVFLVLALLPVIKVDISSQSRGVIRTVTDNVPLSSVVNGRVTFIDLKNNKFVHQGDTLVKLTQESLNTEKATNAQLYTDLQNRITDLTLVLYNQNQNLKTPEIKQEWQHYTSEQTQLQSKITQAQLAYNRNKTLFDKGIIAQAEFEKFQFDLTLAQQAATAAQKSQMMLWQNTKRELENQSKNLKGTLAKINVETQNYYILAPKSGVIENFSGIQTGSFLLASQPIANISVADNLIVENYVLPKDIGLIYKKQSVKFQLDAFNYNQWGLLEGEVIDIDKNSTIQGEQVFFKVRCALKSTEMKLKSGYKTHVSKGMTLTSRYIITRRSLYDLLFDKIDNWINPKMSYEL